MSATMLLSRFQNMPGPMKVGIALLTGASLLGAVAMLTQHNQALLWIILIGLVVVGLLLVAYKAFLKWMEKRKASPLTKNLSENSASTPQGVSEPARRARLDDLRKNFEAGVEKFRAAGKNLYSMPWYVLVGEPGSGKTEAIRRCNVGFPPGLQDQLQGAGGTLNMNWWFTNQAIILDTAGRLMFEEAPPGQTTEWEEFLRMLRKSRPNCPINGMLLVIPADSLICDSAEDIERKAGKIAQQLDNIQRSLGVRFPVFVMVTKSDRINGFREFFDALEDPQLQHQIMGWSNPEDLDTPFRPEQVQEHLDQVRERLVSYRTTLLHDPVHTEDASGRRLDEVDALYTFPDSLTDIGSRLQRYLELIFVAGEWSAKPLFLRGIYFTSSMREGEALDAELAKALGVSVESLPEGRRWEKEKAYFLRDLFLAKVFKERGLVTRAGNVRQTQRRRRAVVLGTGFATAALLMGVTLYSWTQFKTNVGDRSSFWVAVQEEVDRGGERLQLVRQSRANGAWEYNEDRVQIGRYGELTIPEVLEKAENYASQEIAVPRIFGIARRWVGNIDPVPAARALYINSVERPLLEAAAQRMASEGGENGAAWSEEATAALAELIRVETAAGDEDAGAELVNVDVLSAYVFVKGSAAEGDPDEHDRTSTEWLGDARQVLETGRRLFGDEVGADARRTVAPILAAGLDDGRSAGIERFAQSWSGRIKAEDGRASRIGRLSDALDEFDTREDKLLAVARNRVQPETVSDYDTLTNNWTQRFEELHQAYDNVTEAMREVEAAGGDLSDGESLRGWIGDEVVGDAKREYKRLIAAAGYGEWTGEEATESAGQTARALSEAFGRLNERASDEADRVVRSMEVHLSRHLAEADDERLYVQRYRMYQRAQEWVTKSGSEGFDGLPPLPGATDGWRVSEAGDAATFIMDQAVRNARYVTLRDRLLDLPTSAVQVRQRVEEVDVVPLRVPRLPFTAMADGNWEFDRGYSPAGARQVLAEWTETAAAVSDHNGVDYLDRAALTRLVSERATAYEEYQGEYEYYWGIVVLHDAEPTIHMEWSEFAEHIRRNDMNAMIVNQELTRFFETVLGAFEQVPQRDGSDSWDATRRLLEHGLEALRYPPFVTSCRDVVRRWAQLPADACEARARLLSAVNLESYFTVYGSSVPYWDALLLGGLVALTNNCDVSVPVRELAQYERFPLARVAPADDALTRAQVERARELAERVVGGGSRALPERLSVGYEDLDEQLERLRGPMDRTVLERVERVRAMAASLLQVEHFDFWLLGEDPSIDGREGASRNYAFVEVEQADRSARFSTRTPRSEPLLTRVQFQGPALTVRFREHEFRNQRANEVEVRLDEPWNALRLAVDRAEPTTRDGTAMLKAPVLFKGHAGVHEFYYWIGVEFDPPFPLDQWPTRDTWPRLGP